MTRAQFDKLHWWSAPVVIYHYHTKDRKVLGTASPSTTQDGMVHLTIFGEKKSRLVSYKSVSICK